MGTGIHYGDALAISLNSKKEKIWPGKVAGFGVMGSNLPRLGKDPKPYLQAGPTSIETSPENHMYPVSFQT